MRLGRVWALVAVTWALGSFAADVTAAHAQEPRVRVEVDTTEIHVGDRITMRITVEHDVGATVQWPDSLDLGPFEVLAATAEPPVSDGDRVRSSAVLSLTAFELGELEIPSFRVTIAGADGSESSVTTDPFGVIVTSVGLDESGDIRDIKGPLAIPVNLLLLWPWALLVLAAGGIGWWLARRSRRREPAVAAASPAAPRRPPHEVAYEALDRLEASLLLERGQIKEYYIRVSEIIRVYIDGRYGIAALEKTTHDVVWLLQRAGAKQEHLRDFTDFLEECDLVKFAKHLPAPQACREIVPAARRLVDETKETWPPPLERRAREVAPVVDGLTETAGDGPPASVAVARRGGARAAPASSGQAPSDVGDTELPPTEVRPG